MHSSTLVDSEWPKLIYLGSCETSVRLRVETSFVVGKGASQSWEWVSVSLWRVCSSGVRERN